MSEQRPADTVTIVSCPDRLFWTGEKGDEQLLMGLQFPFITVLSFTPEGEFVTYTRQELPEWIKQTADWRISLPIQAEIGDIIEELKDKLGYSERPIQVKPFFIPELGVGICRFPNEYLEVLDNPEKWPQDHYDFVRADVERWRRDGHFVFQWNKDYWMDASGTVISS